MTIKKNRLNHISTAMCFFPLLTASAGASAEDFAQTADHKQAWVTRGFCPNISAGAASRPGGQPSGRNAALIGRLCSACSLTKATDGVNLQITGEHLLPSIAPDATAAEFRNLSVEQQSHALAKPVASRMAAAALEQAGRNLIAAKLAAVVVLGPGEELVAVSTDCRVEGLQELSTGTVTRSVAANRVVFGRTLNGVPVVGNGSTVVVTFANDGAVESFHYDWPRYQADAAQQSTLNASNWLERVQRGRRS